MAILDEVTSQKDTEANVIDSSSHGIRMIGFMEASDYPNPTYYTPLKAISSYILNLNTINNTLLAGFDFDSTPLNNYYQITLC